MGVILLVWALVLPAFADDAPAKLQALAQRRHLLKAASLRAVAGNGPNALLDARLKLDARALARSAKAIRRYDVPLLCADVVRRVTKAQRLTPNDRQALRILCEFALSNDDEAVARTLESPPLRRVTKEASLLDTDLDLVRHRSVDGGPPTWPLAARLLEEYAEGKRDYTMCSYAISRLAVHWQEALQPLALAAEARTNSPIAPGLLSALIAHPSVLALERLRVLIDRCSAPSAPQYCREEAARACGMRVPAASTAWLAGVARRLLGDRSEEVRRRALASIEHSPLESLRNALVPDVLALCRRAASAKVRTSALSMLRCAELGPAHLSTLLKLDCNSDEQRPDLAESLGLAALNAAAATRRAALGRVLTLYADAEHNKAHVLPGLGLAASGFSDEEQATLGVSAVFDKAVSSWRRLGELSPTLKGLLRCGLGACRRHRGVFRTAVEGWRAGRPHFHLQPSVAGFTMLAGELTAEERSALIMLFGQLEFAKGRGEHFEDAIREIQRLLKLVPARDRAKLKSPFERALRSLRGK